MQIATFVITWLQSHARRERGQDLIEYAMLSGLIAAAIVAVGILVYSGALTAMATGISGCIDFTAGGCNPGF
ncbi:MAG: Flp family type IVb pilin [Chloroflexi bacterium]|nr:Flp family type IVb pilin [Chloroflexota bacterium]